MNAPAHDQRIAPEIAAHADAAVRAIRLLLGILSCFVIGAYRPLAGPLSLTALVAVLTAILVSVVALNTMSKRIPRDTRWLATLQALDVAATAALAIALDGPLGQQSWVLLVIPVVSAAVRYGATASVLSWLGGCAAYLTAVYTGTLQSATEITVLVRVPGALLAVAIAVGLLARWMREGWEIQNELTATVAARERRLAVIEQTGHAMKDLTPEDALELSAEQVLALGFDAATIEYQRRKQPPFAIGDLSIVCETSAAPPADRSEPTVTVWTDNEQIRVHSVSLLVSQPGAVVTGWSRGPIDNDHALAMATLLRHTSDAIETSSLLNRLRQIADHDALTGLANRRTLDRELQRCAAESGCVSLAFIDVDNFKSINDGFGHDVGDKVLVALARRLEAVTGPYGTVARYGGDEFVVVLPNVALADAGLFAEAALEAVSNPIVVAGAKVDAGLSIGVAGAQTPRLSTDLMQGADHAAYQAKAAGKASVVLIDLDEPVRRPALRRLSALTHRRD